jgi:hypothetical protein
MKLELSEWRPDMYPGVGVLPKAENVIPADIGYWAIPSPAPAGTVQAYAGLANALWYEVSSARNTFTFFGTGLNLYTLGTVNSDITHAAGDYTPIDPGNPSSSASPWRKTAFGDNVYIVNGIDPVQRYVLDGGGVCTDVATTSGDPNGDNMTGKYIATVKDQIMLGNIQQGPNVYAQRVWWSGLNSPEDFIPSPTTQSDWQDIPDLGEVRGITGGEYGVILMERGVVRANPVGPPTYFSFDTIKVSDGIGCDIPETVIRAKAGTFYHAQHGWFLFDGQQLHTIGNDKIDRWWESDKNDDYDYRITTAALPDLHSVGWLYVSNDAPVYPLGHPYENQRIPNRILLRRILMAYVLRCLR